MVYHDTESFIVVEYCKQKDCCVEYVKQWDDTIPIICAD